MDRWTEEGMNGWMIGLVDRGGDEWMGDWMGGQRGMNGWMIGQRGDEWMDDWLG